MSTPNESIREDLDFLGLPQEAGPKIIEDLTGASLWALAAADDLSGEALDVRLQVEVTRSGNVVWSIHTGDSSYDQSHLGWWGAGSFDGSEDAAALEALAADLLSQAAERKAQSET
jgi:hypothetical protein